MKPLQDADPRRVGSYQLLGVLGEGGMGRVFLGVDDEGHKAAVKVVYAELVRDEDFRKRFTREASATAAVSGRFIARIVASDLEASPPWLATDYIDGPSLHEVVTKQGGALSPSRAQEIAAGLAEALETIHAAGVVHRDVKPANVLVGPDGAYLIDFGIAREAAASTITRTGTVVGTPPFMAPEQIRGRRPLGAPADVFALGGVLAFALTGRHPFGEGDNTSLAYRIVHEEPDLDGVEDAASKALILACLAKKPEDRPTASEVRARLSSAETRALAGPLVESPPGRTGTRRRRRRVAGALATAAVLVIAAGVIGAELGRGKKTDDRGQQAPIAPGSHGASTNTPSSSGSGGTNTSPDASLPGSRSNVPPATGTTAVSAAASGPGATAGPQNPGSNPGAGTGTGTTDVPASASTSAPPNPPSRTATSSAPKPPPSTTAPPTTAPPHGDPPGTPAGASAAVGTESDFSGFVVNVTWQPASGATGYDLHYTNNGSSTGGKTTDTVFHTSGTSYQITGWQGYPTGFCFNVRAVNANGVSAWDAPSPHCM